MSGEGRLRDDEGEIETGLVGVSSVSLVDTWRVPRVLVTVLGSGGRGDDDICCNNGGECGATACGLCGGG